ncbi:MAG: dTDP-glucose 4,6-dehydratase [Solirubrobacteraceae bacterium]|nr:dTDP-glucose 4,6-dehydratase [Solirubrobacteraceae bacterium]
MTGASGFVGGAIAAHLVAAGYEVIGLSRRPGAVPGLSGLLDGNLADTEAAARVARKLDRCDAIVHAAAMLRGSLDEVRLLLTNGLGSQQMLVLAERWDVQRFVYVSSLPVIGRPRELPVSESHPVSPPTAYHASKLYGEHLVALAVADGRPGVSLRLTSPVGAGMPDARIMSAFVRRALAGENLEVAGTGTRAQDYIDVRDIAAAVAACLERPVNGVVNVASGIPVNNRDLAERCVSTLNSPSQILVGVGEDPEDSVRWEVSIGRARSQLGWRPKQDLESSIRAVAAAVAA